jgi:hypothetical protein
VERILLLERQLQLERQLVLERELLVERQLLLELLRRRLRVERIGGLELRQLRLEARECPEEQRTLRAGRSSGIRTS